MGMKAEFVLTDKEKKLRFKNYYKKKDLVMVKSTFYSCKISHVSLSLSYINSKNWVSMNDLSQSNFNFIYCRRLKDF